MSEEKIRALIDQRINTTGQFAYESGVRITEISPGFAQGYIDDGPAMKNPGGTIHGGALATLADTVAGCCACSRGGNCVTSSCSMEFLRPACGRITCTATPKKLGRKISVVAVEMKDEAGKLVAGGTFTFFMTAEKWENGAARA